MADREFRKQSTDNPILDEIIYQCQKMMQGLVLKDEARANQNETMTSLKQSDMYKVIIEGKAKFGHFTYTYDILSQLPSLTRDQIVFYARKNDLIPEDIKPALLELAIKKFLTNYVERNNYYRMLNGLPNINEEGLRLDKNDVKKLDNEFFDTTKFIHEMTDDEINLLKLKGVLDDIMEKHPRAEYLKHVGAYKIDPYIARSRPKFSVLYIPTCESMEIYRKFSERLEINREFILKTVYSDAYKFNSDYYDNFIMMMIIMQAFDDMIVLSPEYMITRDLFDLRTIQYFFEASGVKYYKEIPIKYQKRLVKNLNRLIKYSSSEKNFVDISSLFGFENIELFKYYLLRQPMKDEQGNYKHDTKIDPDTGLNVDDTEANYELKFVKVPIDGLIDEYVRDEIYHIDYDSVTDKDPYWTGIYDKQYVKQNILDHEFNLKITKYMSVDTLYSMTDMSFDIVYFINMILYGGKDMSSITVTLPELGTNMKFELTDLFITLYALSYIYNGVEDKIIYDPVSVLDIKGFNFSVDWDKLSNYIHEKGFTEEELGVDNFTIPKNGFLSYQQMIEVYMNNKNIHQHLLNEMKNAENIDIYKIYKYIYDSLMTTRLNYRYFKNAGNGKLPTTYTQYIKNRNNFLYSILTNSKDILKETDRQVDVSRYINIIVDNIRIFLEDDDFRYIFQGIPTVSLDYIKQYMFLMLNFFKSYKVDLINTNDIFYFDDSYENKLLMLDRVRMRFRLHRKDFLGIEDYPKSRIYNRISDRYHIFDDLEMIPK
ncbi:MAG: hypothetical protein PHC62_00895 [Candidatus Izemoplasmatales bacterium]|nr:hypothetical protein [Candidatus Izemoplasmatales bacterium]